MMSDSGNSSFNSSEYSGNSPGGGSRYSGGYSRGYTPKSFHRGGGGRYGQYNNDNSYSSYHYRGDYYYGPPRYHVGRGSSRGGGHRYSHPYMGDYNNHGSNSYYGGRRSHDDNRRFSATPGNSRYYNNRHSEPWGAMSEPSVPPSYYSGPYGSGNNTPVDHYHRSNSSAIPPTTVPSSTTMNNGNLSGININNSTAVTGNTSQIKVGGGTPSSSSSPYGLSTPHVRRRVDKNESPLYYLTDLDKSTDDPKELEYIRQVFKENDTLDKQLEEHNYSVLKNELELGLLATQCEKDKLSVQLTQEKLDTFLMHS